MSGGVLFHVRRIGFRKILFGIQVAGGDAEEDFEGVEKLILKIVIKSPISSISKLMYIASISSAMNFWLKKSIEKE